MVISPESDADSRVEWFRSSYSNGAGGECVECALTDEGALVRDSKMTKTYGIAVSGDAWSSFVQAVNRTSVRP
ncbi:DUF397 domain-containing protein [Streptomyces massasporeus]|uniref:DUF397 domain-containing protein n=1 Tax=Streptomyces massasporeus TaxID=67324 RepID=UPI0036E01BC1